MKDYKTTLLLLSALVILGIAYFFFQRGRSSMDSWDADFAVKDTANVVQIDLIAFKNNKEFMRVNLERDAKKSSIWKVDGKYDANLDKINNLLSTMYSLQVSEQAHPNARENIIKKLTLDHIRVEIKRKDGDDKVYFVGEQPPIGNGSMMLMKGGQVPYFVELPGVQGYLKPYFSAYLNDWRENILFDVNAQTLKKIEVKYNSADSSYALEKKGNVFGLVTGEAVDSLKLKAYLKGLGKKFAVGFLDRELPNGLDSLKRLPPSAVIKIEKINGEKSVVVLYHRPDHEGTFLGWVQGKNELLLIQNYNLLSILIRRQDLFVKKGA